MNATEMTIQHNILMWVARMLLVPGCQGQMPPYAAPENTITPATLLDLVAMDLVTADAEGVPTGITEAGHAWYVEQIGFAQSAAMVERCVRLGHHHVAKSHPRPAVEVVATSITCYIRNLAGLRVQFREAGDDEWVAASVDTMMYRGDGLVVRADDELDRPVRVPWSRLRLA